MSEEQYNGWTNYATWGAHLLITNESWEYLLDATREAQRDMDGSALREYFADTLLTDPMSGKYCYGNLAVQQMVEAALCEVNWREIREALDRDYSSDVAALDDDDA